MLTDYGRQVCRMDRWPPEMMLAFAALQQDPEACTTLVLGGRFDEATPTIIEATHRAIAGSEWVIFEQSAHLPHLEEPERYLQGLQDVLCRHNRPRQLSRVGR